MSSLIPKKKKIEDGYRKIASIILFIIGAIYILWFIFHLVIIGTTNQDYDIFSTESLLRIILGIIFWTIAYVMYKMIDVERIYIK